MLIKYNIAFKEIVDQLTDRQKVLLGMMSDIYAHHVRADEWIEMYTIDIATILNSSSGVIYTVNNITTRRLLGPLIHYIDFGHPLDDKILLRFTPERIQKSKYRGRISITEQTSIQDFDAIKLWCYLLGVSHGSWLEPNQLQRKTKQLYKKDLNYDYKKELDKKWK